jgi:hypothetical protein
LDPKQIGVPEGPGRKVVAILSAKFRNEETRLIFALLKTKFTKVLWQENRKREREQQTKILFLIRTVMTCFADCY